MRTGLYIIAYDISENKERAHVDKVLCGYGFRIQKSVFECILNESDRNKLWKKLENLDIRSGFVKIYKQEYSFQSRVTGVEKSHPDEGYVFAST